MRILRNIFAVLIGAVVGAKLNEGIIVLSGSIVSLPNGMDPMDIESLKANIHLFEVQHFIFPFLAHALGTFVGAFITGLIAVSHKVKLALIIGFLFLFGGIAMAFMLEGSPIWFIVLDLLIAYLPMAWIGGKLATKIGEKKLT